MCPRRERGKEGGRERGRAGVREREGRVPGPCPLHVGEAARGGGAPAGRRPHQLGALDRRHEVLPRPNYSRIISRRTARPVLSIVDTKFCRGGSESFARFIVKNDARIVYWLSIHAIIYWL